MGYYAAFIDLTGRKCLVVGGDTLAEEKVLGLLESGAKVTAVSKTFNEGLRTLGSEGVVELWERAFSEEDLAGCAVVIDASADETSGVRVAYAARRQGVLVNVVDRPVLCDFIAPALVKHGPLQVAISTSGRSPFLASHLRRRLEGDLGPEWGQLTEMVGELRDELRAQRVPREQQDLVYSRVPESGAVELLRDGQPEAARQAVRACADEVRKGS